MQLLEGKEGEQVGAKIQGKTLDMLNSYEKQALEAVNKIQNWESGKVDGTAVNVFLTVPVIF